MKNYMFLRSAAMSNNGDKRILLFLDSETDWRYLSVPVLSPGAPISLFEFILRELHYLSTAIWNIMRERRNDLNPTMFNFGTLL